jgi:hypothetical protein
MGPSMPSSPVTTSPNHTPCLKDVVGGGMRSRVKTSSVRRGSDFDGVGTSQMVVIHEGP